METTCPKMLAKPLPNIPKSPLPVDVLLSKTSVCFLNSLLFTASFLFPLVCNHLTPTLPFFFVPPPSYITMIITNLMDNWWAFLFIYLFLLFNFFFLERKFLFWVECSLKKLDLVNFYRGSRLLDRSSLRRFSSLIFPCIDRVKTWSSTLQIDDCGSREKLYPLTCFVVQSNCL